MSAIGVIKAIGIAADMLSVGNAFIAAHQKVTAIAEKAKAEGRDHLTDEEWEQATVDLDDAARADLADWIARKKAAQA